MRWFCLIGVSLALGCSDAGPREEARTGRGTFLVLGQPMTVDYEVMGDKLVFGGDMELDRETEIVAPEGELGELQLPALKNGSTLKAQLWPNAKIPYVIHSSVTTPARVRQAMDEWENKTAIRFVKRNGEKAYLYVWESSQNTVCSAQVGYNGGKRNLNLRANGGCNLGVIVHELGHTISFMHEHQRTDRDQYVKINLNCTSLPSAYNKLGSGVYKFGPYDIKSTMHYRSTTLNSCAYPKSAILGKNGEFLQHNWENLSPGDIDATAKMYGPPANDADADGVSDAKDNCPNDPNAQQTDTDNDGKGDACDGDDDGDGVADGSDNCSKKANAGQNDTDGDGKGDVCDGDDDGDGVSDANDNCQKVANAGQADLDKDGQGNACDDDDDGDGVPDATDNCPKVANPNQEPTACSADADGDGHPDTADNCPGDANEDQSDLDQDGLGDVCDPDDDGDGIDDASDPCPERAGDGCLADGDGDGVSDALDNCPTVPNPEQEDGDGDDVGDACPDTDGDMLHDEIDNCPEVANFDQADEDQDGIGDACDTEPETPPDTPGDGSNVDDPTPVTEAAGGCSTSRSPGGSGAWLGLVLLALVRRRGG